MKVAILTMPGGSFVTHYLVKHLDVCGIVVDTGKWGSTKKPPPPKSTLQKLAYHYTRGGVRGAGRALARKLLRQPEPDPFAAAARAEEQHLARLDAMLVGHPYLSKRADLREFAPLDEIAAFYKIPLVRVQNINDAESEEALRRFAPDLGIIVGGRIVKPNIIGVPKVGMLNKHSAILPKHRGLSGEYWCLYYEDFEHLGVTVHYVDPGLDSGNILVQKNLVFEKGDTPQSLRFKSEVVGREAIVEAAELIASTGTRGTPQDEAQATKNTAPTLETDRELYAKLPTLWERYGR